MRNGLPGNRLVHPQQFQSSNGIGMGGYGQGMGQGMVGQGMGAAGTVDQWQPPGMQQGMQQGGVQGVQGFQQQGVQGVQGFQQQGVQGFQQQGVQGFQGMPQFPWGEGGIRGGDGAVGGSMMGGIPHPHIRPRIRQTQQQLSQQHQQQRVLPDYMSGGGGGANDAISLV